VRALLLLCALGACADDATPPLFPADYAATYTEVRNCRSSSDHDLHRIRVLVEPQALAPYQMRSAPFPVGAIVLKAEYDFADTSCAAPPIEWTVMQKLGTPDQLGWTWQRVDAKRNLETENDPRCIQCHTDCGVPPDGYDGTCTMP
jgi:hypothetical protein